MVDFEVSRVAVAILWAEDVERTVHFYRDVLGLELMADPHHQHLHRTYFQMPGSKLIILKGRPHPAEDAIPPEFPLFALAVDHLDAAVDRLRAHNVPMPWGVEGGDVGRWVKFRDPAGNLIELVEYR